MKTLRDILKDNGISYKVVADALGVHINNIQRYDDLTKRKYDEILIISGATGIPVSELLGAGRSTIRQTSTTNDGLMAGTICGDVDRSNGKTVSNNYTGMSFEDIVIMVEARLQQMSQVLEENRRLTDEVIRQSEGSRELIKRINLLTDKLLKDGKDT